MDINLFIYFSYFSQEWQIIFRATFFKKAKGTLPPERGHFLCLLKTSGGGGLGPFGSSDS
jgi:hypothetical protein